MTEQERKAHIGYIAQKVLSELGARPAFNPAENAGDDFEVLRLLRDRMGATFTGDYARALSRHIHLRTDVEFTTHQTLAIYLENYTVGDYTRAAQSFPGVQQVIVDEPVTA